MPRNKMLVGVSTNRTTDLRMPKKNNGTNDERYKSVQFTNGDGHRDMRTTLTSNRK